jgi:tetratricopeptide (TPR) repeat protein
MTDKTALIKEAQKYLAKGQLDKAVAEWEKIVREYPDGNNYNVIGDLYLKKGDKKNAIESYHKAANFFRNEGFSLKAIALFKKVLNINPNNADALYALGELSEEKELVTDATKYYLAAADSIAKEGRKDELLTVYEKILSLSPSNIPLRTKVAEIFTKEGLKSDAAKEYLYVAGIYEDKGDIQKSKDFYQKAIELQPLNKDAVVGLSCLHEKTGNREKASELMKEAAVLFHDDVAVLMRAAELTLAENDTRNSKSYLSRLIEIDPQNTSPRRLLGEIYLNEGQREKAWQEYIVVLDEMMREGKNDDAIHLLESFREIEPVETGQRLISLYKQLGGKHRVVEELTSLGNIYYDRGLQEEALACYSEAFEIEPEDDYLRGRIADLRGEHPGEIPEFPEPFTPESEPVEAGESQISDQMTIGEEKTVDELFTEADIFIRYGLLFEAEKILDGLKLKAPENIDLHLRLKSVYSDIKDKDSAVTECLILSELYKRTGDSGSSQKMLREAYEISPADPRLQERKVADFPEPTAFPSAAADELIGSSPEEKALVEDYEEELAEADFYARQGLIQEALKILFKMQRLFPENRDVAERLESLGGGEGIQYTAGMPGTIETPEMSVELSGAEGKSPEAVSGGKTPWGQEISKKELVEKGPEEELKEGEFEDLSFGEHEVVDAQEMPEPALDNDVLEIFQEFKKGLEGQLEDEDSETHYNLGIAYKEMGLVDDAIKEFQTAKNDKKRFLQASSMLGVCYMEKGLYSLAIDVLTKVLDSIKEHSEAYWSIKYELAEAYEKNNNLAESLKLYTEVYGWNAKFRDISEKISLLKTQAAKTAGQEKPKGRKDRVSYL